MILIEFPEQNIVIARNQPQYMPMPANVDLGEKGIITCCWQLSLKERIKLLFTGKLWHQVMTFGHNLQPQLLLLEKPEGLKK